jgi:hypothetical protein
MIMFYNGFNLLIDLLVGMTVFYFTHKHAWWNGYQAGIVDTTDIDITNQTWEIKDGN